MRKGNQGKRICLFFFVFCFFFVNSACTYDGAGAQTTPSPKDLYGAFFGPWGTLVFGEDKTVKVYFNEEFVPILAGRPNDAEYQYVFIHGSFGETAYDRADGFILIHEDFRDNLMFTCPQFATAENIYLMPSNDEFEATIFSKNNDEPKI